MNNIIGIIFCFILVLPTVLYVFGYHRVVEVYRRKKHKVWFEHYDRAVKSSFLIGSRLRESTDYINNKMLSAQKQLFDGDCLAEDYRDIMKTLTADYCDAVSAYKHSSETLGIDADLKAADAYAKEHNLEWGFIYED